MVNLNEILEGLYDRGFIDEGSTAEQVGDEVHVEYNNRGSVCKMDDEDLLAHFQALLLSEWAGE